MIAPARPEDFAAIVALLAECGLPYADLIPERLPLFEVAKQGLAVNGIGAVERFGEHGLLRSLAVAAPYRERGLATRLVSALEADARRSGVVALYLLTSSAEAFFRNRGYRVIARSEVPSAVAASTEFVELCPRSAKCMVKRLC